MTDTAGGGNNNVTMTLSVSQGTLSLGTQTGLSVSGAGTLASPLTSSGIPSALNADLLTLVYTPTSGYFGGDHLNLSVLDTSDGEQGTPEQVTITVNPLPPTAVAASYSVSENAMLTVSAPGVLGNDTDPNHLTLTAVTFSTPAHGTLAPDANGDGGFVYTPTAGFYGTDSFTYEAADSVATSTPATVTITVNPLAPTAVNDSYSVTENQTLTITAPGVLVNDTDPNKLTLTAVSFSTPAHGTLTPDANGDGGFVYKPNVGFYGSDSFTYEAADSLATSAPATVTITVNPLLPTAVAASYSVSENAMLTVSAPGVLGNDTDPNHLTLTAVTFSTPAHGTLAPDANGDGGFVYTPTTGFYGTDSFTYEAADSVATSTPATVTITVNPLPPTAVNQSYSVTENATLTVSASGVLANDTDPNHLALTAVSFSTPAHGTLTLDANGDGGFVYTPTAGFYGTDSFTYEAADSVATSTPAMVTITVNPPSEAPTVTAPPSASVNENGSLTFSTANGNAITLTDVTASGNSDSMTLAVSHGTLTLASTTGLVFSGAPNGSARFTVTGTLANLNTALNGLVYTPISGYGGSDTLSLSLKDSRDNLTGSASVALTVTAPPKFSAPPSASVNENGSLTFSTANGNAITLTDVTASGNSDSMTLAVSHGTLTLASTTGLVFSGAPNGSARFTVTGTLANLNTALNGLVYTPISGYGGSDTLSLSLKDSRDNLTGSASVAIAVTAKPAVTIGAAVLTSVQGDPVSQANVVIGSNVVDAAESPTADSIETDMENEALQWAGLTAAMEILST